VRIAKKTQHFTITEFSFPMLFGEIIAVYIESYTKSIIKNAALLIVKGDGTYSYHQALKG
jgi:hypothetical protein